MQQLAQLFIKTLAVLVTAYLIPGIEVKDFLTALVVALLLGLFNVFVKPILIFLTLPVTILTLGLFVFVINGLVVLLVSAFVPGFVVSGVGAAILFSLVLTLTNWVMDWITK